MFAAVDAGVALTDSTLDQANAPDYTFSSQSLGADTANRTIIVAATVRAASTGVGFGTVTVGGAGATEQFEYQVNDDGASVAIGFWTSDPSGTTGDVFVDINLTALRCGIGVWRATDLLSTTAHDTGSVAGTTSPVSTTLDIPAGGVAVGMGWGNQTDAHAWTAGLTEDFDTAFAEGNRVSGASDAFATLQTGLTITTNMPNSVLRRMACVSFR